MSKSSALTALMQCPIGGPRRLWLGLLAAAACTTAFAGQARAATDTISFSPATINIAPGQSFTVDVMVTATHPWSGFSLYLNAQASSLFTVISQKVAASDTLFSAGNANDSASAFPISLAATGNSPDFGYTSTANNGAAGIAYDIETLTIQALPAVQVNTAYTLTLSAGSQTYEIFGTNPSNYSIGEVSVPAATLTVNAPEPSAALLLLAGSSLLLRRRHKGRM